MHKECLQMTKDLITELILQVYSFHKKKNKLPLKMSKKILYITSNKMNQQSKPTMKS